MGAPGTESGAGEPWPGAALSLCLLNTGSSEMSLTPGPSSRLSK